MDTLKIRVKVGPHEFDAEGPPDIVEKMYAEWRGDIAAAPTPLPIGQSNTAIPLQPPGPQLGFTGNPPQVLITPPGTTTVVDPIQPPPGTDVSGLFLMDTKRGVITLKVHPTGESRNADAALLVLYGYKRLLQRDEVLAGHIKDSLDDSGIRLDRVDRTIGGFVDTGLLLKSGMGKGGKYRLTQTGLQRADSLAKTLVSQMV